MRYALLATVAAIAFLGPEQVETVIVTIDGKSTRINKSDYDESVHGAIDQEATDKQGTPPMTISTAPTYAEGITPPPAPSAGVANAVPPSVPSPGQIAVAQTGSGSGKNKKWQVVFVTTGEPVVDVRLDPAGYDSEALAWEAAMPVIHNPTPLGSPGPGSDNVIPGSPASVVTTPA